MAPGRVRVDGYGVEAELKGLFRGGGTVLQPDVTGQLDVVRGNVEILGKTLSLDEGGVHFYGEALTNPALNLAASEARSGAEITVRLQGMAQQPELVFESDPDMPQDEIISRLLFGDGVASLSPLQGVQLANALSELAGVGGRHSLDVTGSVREFLGVDTLGFNAGGRSDGRTDTTFDGTLEVGKYISDDVFLRVEQGLTPESREVGIEVKLSPVLSVESEAGANSSGSVSLKLQRDY